MGAVYRAHDERLDREVAIKLLPDKLCRDRVRLARFEREAKALARLSHPNILSIFELGEERGVPFVVTELLAGKTLREHLRHGALPWTRSIQIGASIADGLAAAHAQGIIHRDIKPENVVLTTDDHVKILDFGLARFEDREFNSLTSDPTKTAPGLVLGTVHYMAPEQVRGESADSRSDIFALGSTLYEMLTGRKAFARGSSADTLAAILKENPAAPSDLAREIRKEVDRLVLRCLAKQPKERFQSAMDLAFALRGLMPESSGAVRNLIAMQRDRPSIAVLPFVNLSADPEQEFFCDGIAEEIIHALAHVQGLRVVARTSSFTFKGRLHDVREIGRRLEVTHVLEGSVRKAGNRLRITAQLIDVTNGYDLWSERFDRQIEDIFTIQDEIALAVTGNMEIELLGTQKASLVQAGTNNLAAHNAYLAGLFEWNKMTPEGFARCQEMYREAIRHDSKFAPAYARLADSMTSVTWWADQPPALALEHALPLVEKAIELDSNLAHAHSVRGVCTAFFERKWFSGESSLRRAVALAPNDASAQCYLGLLLLVAGRTDEAAQRAQIARLLDPLSPNINVWSGFILFFSGRSDDGFTAIHSQVKMTPHLWMPRYWLSLLLAAKGHFEEAKTEATTALAGANENSLTLCHLACIEYRRGEQSSGEALFDRLQQRARTGYVSPMFLTWLHLARGENETALQCAQAALDAKDPWVATYRLVTRFLIPSSPAIERRLADELP